MYVTNRSLMMMGIAASLLALCALVLTLGAQFVPAETPQKVKASDTLVVRPTVTRSGAQKVPSTGQVVVRAPSTSALMDCELNQQAANLKAGVARFGSVSPSGCRVKLSDAKTAYGPVFPGDSLRCKTVDSKTTCTGGIAKRKAGSVSVSSAFSGTLVIDGVSHGELPKSNIPLTVGTHKVRVEMEEGRQMPWTVRVAPREKITMHFPEPSPPRTKLIRASATSADTNETAQR